MAMKKYTDDYELETTIDDKGREKQVAVYRGNYFEIENTQEELVKFKKTSFLLLALILIFQISIGFVNNIGMNQILVSFPYVFSFFPLIYMAASILSLPKEKRNYKRDEVGLSFERMMSSSKILLFLICSGILGEIIFLLFVSMENNSWLEYLYLSLGAIVGVTVYSIINLQKQIVVKEIPKQKQ